jgi:hypothetical protein
MRYIIVSRTHRLLHHAAKLEAEGHEVESFTTRSHYRSAYRGILSNPVREWDWEAKLELGDSTVLTDDYEVTEALADHPQLYGRIATPGVEQSGLMLAGWWNGTELSCPHWVLIETGAWPGGMGRQVPVSVAIVAAQGVPEGVVFPVAPAGFRGLVRAEVLPGGHTGLTRLGWMDLHQQLLLSQQVKLSDALEHGPTLAPNMIHFGTVISVPPWPNPPTRSSKRYPVNPEMPKALRQHLVWHDAALTARGALESCGLDGFVALGVACTRHLATARALVQEAAMGLGINELQPRPDAGTHIEQIITRLEYAKLI